MVQDEVRWVLEVIKTNWPAMEFPDHVVRIDRDEPEILETAERTRTVELTRHTPIGASLSSRDRSPLGTEFHNHVETVVSVRIEGLHESEFGQIRDKDAFNRIVNYAKRAIQLEREYPTIDADDDVGLVHYEDARIEGEQSLNSDNKDYFREDFTVRLVGKEELP